MLKFPCVEANDRLAQKELILGHKWRSVTLPKGVGGQQSVAGCPQPMLPSYLAVTSGGGGRFRCLNHSILIF
jgi:hypothetical protein